MQSEVEVRVVSAKPTWIVRTATPADREAALRLTQRAFRESEPATNAGVIWDWIFVKNPSGARMHYLVAEAPDRLAGQYAVMPQRFQHEGKPILALLSLHTATDPDYERQGIFSRLAKQLYTDASREAPVVYGFPNRNSAPVFYNKLDWVEMRPSPAFARPLANMREVIRSWRPEWEWAARVADALGPLHRVLAKCIARVERLRGAEIVPFDRFGPWADELWGSLRGEMGTCAVRDAAFLNWRFVDGPFEYQKFALERQGAIEGFAVVAIREWRGGHLAYLMELMARPGDASGARALVSRVILEALAAKACAVYALATARHPHRRALGEGGFVPARWMGGGQSFGVRINGPGVIPNRILHVDDWYISGADLDYV